MNESLVFPNKRPKLLGAGEVSVGIITSPATAKLINSLSITEGEDSSGLGGGRAPIYPEFSSNLSTTEEILRTVPLNITNSLNRVIFHGFGIFGTDGATRNITFRVRETNLSGSIIGTLGPFSTPSASPSESGAEEWNLDNIISNISPSITQFVLTRQAGVAGNHRVGDSALFLWVINLNDTHAGAIDAAAVAGKQINAADSHRAHESGVLPS